MLFGMSNAPYTVSVVVDRDCGQHIRELLEAGPLWVVDSESNRESAQKLWADAAKCVREARNNSIPGAMRAAPIVQEYQRGLSRALLFYVQ